MTTKVAKMTSVNVSSSTPTFPTANNAANTTEDSKIDSFMISTSSSHSASDRVDGKEEKDRTMSTGDDSTCTSSTSASTLTTTSMNTSSSVTHGFFTEHNWTTTNNNSSNSNASASDNKNNVNSNNEHIIPMISLASKNNSLKKPTSSSSSSSSSTALDALAFFASNVHNNLSSSLKSTTNTKNHHNDHDSEMMPPPPPRMKGRARSASNPEGMEKWDSYSYFRHNGFTSSSSSAMFSNPSSLSASSWSSSSARRHFVLPTSILEEELAEVNETCKIHAEQKQMEEMTHHYDMDSSFSHGSRSKKKNQFVPSVRRGMTIFSVNQLSNGNGENDDDEDSEMYGTSPTTVMTQENGGVTSSNGSNGTKSTMSLEAKKRKTKKAGRSSPRNHESNKTVSSSSITNDDNGDDDDDDIEPLEDESNLEPQELLRRARNKLFEDLTCAENCGLDKGVMPFPHSLDKYKEVYNKNGRIGIYTPAERAAIIAKFNSKRTRRVWNKKIRYNCRKNLADRRMRVKGRFVKRSVEQGNTNNKDEGGGATSGNGQTKQLQDTNHNGTSSASSSRTNSPTSQLAPVQEGSLDSDVDMPDVNDPEAGFKPTAKQPYRRTRRHTIT